MAGYGNRRGGTRAAGGSSVAAGRAARSRYQMQQANRRWRADAARYMPNDYSPRNTRRR